MQREISNRVLLGQITSPLDEVGLLSAIYRAASDYPDAGEKVKKLENFSELELMTLTLRDSFPVPSSWYFRACLQKLILKKNLQARPTKTWNN